MRLGDATGGGTTDSLHFEMEGGDGAWPAVGEITLGAEANLNHGWNLRVLRDLDGTWSVSRDLGSLGAPARILQSFSEASITSGTHTGIGWRSSLTDSEDFGFENFVLTVPSPTALSSGLTLLVVLAIAASRR